MASTRIVEERVIRLEIDLTPAKAVALKAMVQNALRPDEDENEYELRLEIFNALEGVKL